MSDVTAVSERQRIRDEAIQAGRTQTRRVIVPGILRPLRAWIERVQDISGDDILAAGVDSHVHRQASYWERAQKEAYAIHWNKANRGYPWDSNPWVVAVEFEVEGETK